MYKWPLIKNIGQRLLFLSMHVKTVKKKPKTQVDKNILNFSKIKYDKWYVLQSQVWQKKPRDIWIIQLNFHASEIMWD